MLKSHRSFHALNAVTWLPFLVWWPRGEAKIVEVPPGVLQPHHFERKNIKSVTQARKTDADRTENKTEKK